MQNNAIAKKSILAGGFQTQYLEAGEANATPVLLLHDGGFGGSAETSWEGVMPGLARAGYRVLAPDMLGYGGTDKAFFFDRSATEFRASHIGSFCSALGLSGVHFVGTSFGGTLIMRTLAASPSPWPMASACSISGTGGPWRVPEVLAKLGDYDGSVQSMQNNTIAFVADQNYEGFDAKTYLEKRHAQSLVPGHYGALAAARLKAPWADQQPPSDGYPNTLRDCKVPLLIVEPTDDPSCLPNWGAKIQEVLPTAMVEKISGLHSPNVDRPGLVVDTLVTWLKRVDKK